MVRKLYWTDVENETAKTRDCGHGQRHSEMTLQQITLHRTEVLKLLRHIQEIRTAVDRHSTDTIKVSLTRSRISCWR
jgi:hypothetical protein